MIGVHAPDHVRTAVLERVVQELDLLLPARVGSRLAVGEEEVLAAVEDAMRGGGHLHVVQRSDIVEWETGIHSGNAEQAAKAQQQSGRSASLQDDLVGEDEHAGLGEQIGVDVVRFDDGQDLAVDQVQHALPDGGADCLQTIFLGAGGQSIRARGEPDLEELLGALKGVGRV